MESFGALAEAAEQKEDEWRTQTDAIQKGLEALKQDIGELEQRLGFILLQGSTLEINPEVAPPETMEPISRSLLIATLGGLRGKLRGVIGDIQKLKERLDI